MNSPVVMQYFFLFLLGCRSILLRRWIVLLNAMGTIITVIMLLSFLAVKTGFETTLSLTGDEKIAMVLREGTQAEISSVLLMEEVDVLIGFPGIRKSAQSPMVSPETYVMVDIETPSGNSIGIPVRGLDAVGVSLREGFRLLSGRLNEEGKNEILVGQSLIRAIPSLTLDSEITFGKAQWKITGIFDFGGDLSVFEGEIWTDNRVLQSQFKRDMTVQSVRIALEDSFTVEDLRAWVQLDKRLAVQIKSEKEFFRDLSEKTENLIFYIAWPLSIVMAIGALAGALNLMHSMVQNRAKEFAVIRSVGFKKTAIVLAVVSESMLISLVSAIVGCLIGFMLFDGAKGSMLSGGHAQIFYTYKIDMQSCFHASLLALVLGFWGGFLPAIKATKGTVKDAFDVL